MQKELMKFSRAGLAAVVFATTAFASVNAMATTWLYQYTGNNFTTTLTPFTTSDAIHFQFESTGLLGNNLNDSGFSSPILNWSLSLGPLSFSSANSVLYSMNFSTNSIGNITGYQFTTQTNVVAPNLLPAEYPPTPYEEEVVSSNLPSGPGSIGTADLIYIPSIHQDSYYAYNSNNPGTWTISAVPVPEPETYAMMLAGLGLMGFMVRRKKAA